MESVKLKKDDRIFWKLRFFRMLYKVKNKRPSTTIFYSKKGRVFLDFKKSVQSIMFLHAYYEISEMGAFLKGPLRALSGNTKGKCLRK